MARPMHAGVCLTAPWRDPVSVLASFAEEPWAIGFLSSPGQGRWSYLARNPDATVLLGASDPGDPFPELQTLLGSRLPSLPDGPPFQGGLAGLACYELADRLEPLGLERSLVWPDLAVGRYASVLAFDHREQTVTAIGRGETDNAAFLAAQAALSWQAVCRPSWRAPLAGNLAASDGQAHEAAVAQIIACIHAGDLFQANIARRWRGRLIPGATPFDVARRLADRSPAPFAGYLRLPSLAVVSNSPERFLKVDADGSVVTQPIKGTRRRGRSNAEDRMLIRELLASEKDRAENLMIVDLMRNDLSRVCVPGSVAAPALFTVESFANVHHLVSTVTGRLAQGRHALDLLAAAFPPGSITGAPKVQAMKTIARWEPPRGPYCGALFWAGCDGAFDSSVLIRTVACVQDDEGWHVEARAGGGIVADSVPREERAETETKIAALQQALTGAWP